MIQTRYKLLNALAITLLIFISCGFQTSLWNQITGGSPAPQIWLLIILYLVLYRSYFEAMFMAYYIALIIKSFSAIPLGVIWPILFLMVTPTSYIKSRMFWPSTRYFVITSFGFILVFHLFYIFLSLYLEVNSTPFSFAHRFIEIILTTLFAAPLYWLLNFIDKVTLPEIIDTHGARE